VEPENAPKLAAAVEALRRDAKLDTQAADAAEQAFAKADGAMQSATRNSSGCKAWNWMPNDGPSS